MLVDILHVRQIGNRGSVAGSEGMTHLVAGKCRYPGGDS